MEDITKKQLGWFYASQHINRHLGRLRRRFYMTVNYTAQTDRRHQFHTVTRSCCSENASSIGSINIFYLRRGDCFHFFFVRYKDGAKTTQPIFTKFSGKTAHGPRKKPLYFGGDPDLCMDSGMF